MILDVTCTDSGILAIAKVIKNIFYWIQIFGPILALISLSISITKAVTTNDKDNIKKYRKNMINSFIAMAMLFFLPYLMDITMQLVGNKSSFTSCWNSIDNVKLKYSSNYIKTKEENKSKEKEKTKAYVNPKDYHGKPTNGCLDYSYRGNGTVKSQFSSDTLKIVENHLYDFNAQNFNTVISSYGGFEKYAKSLGGVFSDYYGKTVTERTEYAFQRTAEYVLGWMYMYGWDYMNGGGHHVKWGGSNYTNDAFYANGGFVGESPSGDFDRLIRGDFGLGYLSSECGGLEAFIYHKMGMSQKSQIYPKPTKLKDLKVGDGVYFFEQRVDKSDENKWTRGLHNVIVGEVYKDYIVLYDAGSRYQNSRNYKHIIKKSNTGNEEEDYAAITKEYGFQGWGARRFYNFEPNAC